MYITYVHTTILGETTFPEFDPTPWQEISRERYNKDEKHQYDYSFVTLVRRI
jgi:dihydrofolate reductase